MNYYLVNLSIADLLISIFCPIYSLVKEMSPRQQFPLPAIFCKAGIFYTVVCMVASTLTLSAISCDRFIAVIFPLRTRVTQRKARWSTNYIFSAIISLYFRYFIVSVWIVASLVASPFLAYRKITEFRVKLQSKIVFDKVDV